MKKCLFFIALLLGLLIRFELFSQSSNESLYKIEITSKGRITHLTGFKIKGISGVFTAYHGFVGIDINHYNISIVRYKPASSFVLKNFDNCKIGGIDKEHDLVFIPLKDDSVIGYEIATNLDFPYINSLNEVIVLGFPVDKTSSLGFSINTESHRTRLLGEVLNLNLTSNGFKQPDAYYPTVNENVLVLLPNVIHKGMSGGPVLNQQNKLIGTINGVEELLGNKLSAWVLIWRNENKELSKSEGLVANKNGPKIIGKELSSGLAQTQDTTIKKIKFHYPFATRKSILRLGVCTPMSLFPDLTIKRIYPEISFDTKPFYQNPSLMVGLYALTNYLAQKTSNSNPIQASPNLSNSTSSNLKFLVGLQASKLFFQHPTNHFYLGGGGLWLGQNKEFNNFRGFIGHRRYFSQQRWGIELKAVYIKQFGSDNINMDTNQFSNRNYFLKYIYFGVGLNYHLGFQD